MTKLEEKIQEIFDNTKKKQFTGFSEDEFIDEEEAIEQLATLCRDYAEKMYMWDNQIDDTEENRMIAQGQIIEFEKQLKF